MSDQDPKSQSPSGADAHNSYGLKPQADQSKSDPTPASDSQDIDPRSQSPSGAAPHNSYGVPQQGQGDKSSDSAPAAPNTADAFQKGVQKGTDKRVESGRSKL